MGPYYDTLTESQYDLLSEAQYDGLLELPPPGSNGIHAVLLITPSIAGVLDCTPAIAAVLGIAG